MADKTGDVGDGILVGDEEDEEEDDDDEGNAEDDISEKATQAMVVAVGGAPRQTNQTKRKF